MKRKINIDRPPLDSGEIASKQNFSSILSQLPKVNQPPFYKTGWFITTMACVAGIIIITTNYSLDDKTDTLNNSTANTEAIPPSVDPDGQKELGDQVSLAMVSEVTITNPEQKPEAESIPVAKEKSEDVNSPVATKPIDQTAINELKLDIAQAKAAYDQCVMEKQQLIASAPIAPTKNGNPDRQFVLDVQPDEFPELAMYKNLLFEVESNDPNFSPSVYTQEWENVALKPKTAGKTYYLTLYGSGTSKTFSVFPVFKGGDYDLALQKYQAQQTSYQNNLDAKLLQEQQLKTDYENKVKKLNTLTQQGTDLSTTE